MALLNVLMAFNLLNGGYGLIIAAAAFVIAFVFIVLLATKREIVYIDPDTDFEMLTLIPLTRPARSLLVGALTRTAKSVLAKRPFVFGRQLSFMQFGKSLWLAFPLTRLMQ